MAISDKRLGMLKRTRRQMAMKFTYGFFVYKVLSQCAE